MRAAALPTSALLLALVGCGTSVAGQPTPSSVNPADSALAATDMCVILSDDELRSFGQRPETREVEDGLGDLGCGWLGTPITLSLTRHLTDTADDTFDRAENFVTLRENDIGSRDGTLAQVDDASCNQHLDAGSGSVLVIVGADQGGNVDPCAQAVAVAELIAPRLPAIGS